MFYARPGRAPSMKQQATTTASSASHAHSATKSTHRGWEHNTQLSPAATVTRVVQEIAPNQAATTWQGTHTIPPLPLVPAVKPYSPPHVSLRWTLAPTRRDSASYPLITTPIVSPVFRHIFHKGDILWVPFHEPARDSTPTVRRLSTHSAGHVYSTHRPVIVILLFARSMLCLPLYTWKGRGIASRPESTKLERVQIKNYDDVAEVGIGELDPVVVKCLVKPLERTSTIQLTAPMKVTYRSPKEYKYIAQLDARNYDYLMRLYRKIHKKADEEVAYEASRRADTKLNNGKGAATSLEPTLSAWL